jgi:hypothetical protein
MHHQFNLFLKIPKVDSIDDHSMTLFPFPIVVMGFRSSDCCGLHIHLILFQLISPPYIGQSVLNEPESLYNNRVNSTQVTMLLFRIGDCIYPMNNRLDFLRLHSITAATALVDSVYQTPPHHSPC